MKAHFALATVTILTLSGCAFSDDPVDNLNTFYFGKSDGDLSGEYNPVGFSSEEVQKQIAGACKENDVTEYVENTTAEGLVTFSASCMISRFGESAEYEVKRSGPGFVLTKLPSFGLPF